MPEITKNKEQSTKNKDRIVWLLLALVILFIYFFGLTIPLLGPDEPRYAQVAREMFERGDWVTPTLGGFDWFEKPALLYWLQIASYHLFGVSEFAARFGSAVFGIGTILSLWILGRFLATENTENHRESETNEKDSFFSVFSVAGKDFANWLALIAASSIGLLAFSRGASFDIILTFPITASLVSFFIFDLTQRREDAKAQNKDSQKFYLLPFAFCLLFYFFIGVALIAKGLVGIVFPFAIVALYYVLSWKLPSKTFIFSLFWGTILSLLVACAWYLPMYQANGWKFIDEFFIQHHFQRYTSNKYQHPQPFWFFFLVLPLMTIPWLPFFLTSIYKAVSGQLPAVRKKNITHHSSLITFALAWMLVPLIFFSLSGSKLPGYILPALPAALILTAEYVFGFVQKSPKRKYALQILAFLTFVVVAVLLQFVVPKFADADSTKSLIETANAKGYEGEKVVNLYTVSHNAEFYAAGRLLRETDGKLKRYDDFSVLVNDLKASENARILVLVPQKDVRNLIKDSNSNDMELLDENGDLAVILVKVK